MEHERNKTAEDTPAHADGTGRRGALIESFWALVHVGNELGYDLARSLGMRVTDSVAIVEIRRAEESGEPTTPARLAERIHLTTGATSLLLNRLESGGHIGRRRGHADRRRVTLHLSDATRASLDNFQDPVRSSFEDALAEYSPEQIDFLAGFVSSLRDAMEIHHR